MDVQLRPPVNPNVIPRRYSGRLNPWFGSLHMFDPSDNLGQSCIYIVGSQMLPARVTSIATTDVRIDAQFEAELDIQACRFNRIRYPDTPFVKEWFKQLPERSTWKLESELDPPQPFRLYLDANLWQYVSPYGGTRIVFMNKYVQRFHEGDPDWLSEFFSERRGAVLERTREHREE